MAETYHRAQILLEPQQHQQLAQIARQQNRSISDVTREVVRLGLQSLQRDRSVRLEALDRLRELRERLCQIHGSAPDGLVAEVRAERSGALPVQESDK